MIAQVRRIVADGARPASQIDIPGYFVDDVVVDPKMINNSTFHMTRPTSRRLGGLSVNCRGRLCRPTRSSPAAQAARSANDSCRSLASVRPLTSLSSWPRKVVLMTMLAATIGSRPEHGSYGGVVIPGWQFSANINPVAILDGLYQLDVMDEVAFCEFAALAFAQFDASGAVNVSRFGAANPGAGGFIDIAHNAKRLIFAGTFATAGLDVGFSDGALDIRTDGKILKFVDTVESVTSGLRWCAATRSGCDAGD